MPRRRREARPRHHLVCALLLAAAVFQFLCLDAPSTRRFTISGMGQLPLLTLFTVSALASDFTDTYLYVNPTQPQEAAVGERRRDDAVELAVCDNRRRADREAARRRRVEAQELEDGCDQQQGADRCGAEA